MTICLHKLSQKNTHSCVQDVVTHQIKIHKLSKYLTINDTQFFYLDISQVLTSTYEQSKSKHENLYGVSLTVIYLIIHRIMTDFKDETAIITSILTSLIGY